MTNKVKPFNRALKRCYAADTKHPYKSSVIHYLDWGRFVVHLCTDVIETHSSAVATSRGEQHELDVRHDHPTKALQRSATRPQNKHEARVLSRRWFGNLATMRREAKSKRFPWRCSSVAISVASDADDSL